MSSAERVVQILLLLALAMPPRQAQAQAYGVLLDDAARTALSALRGRARTLDELCTVTGWPAPRALAVLTNLEVGGWVEGRSGGRYGIVGPHRRPK